MKRLIAPAIVAAAALALSACGGGGGEDGGGGTSAPAKAATGVSVKQLAGVGQVLVDPRGKAIYTSDQERSGKVVCDKSCTTFWEPVAASARTTDGAGTLGAVTRPDGTRQLTANGRPLYTFVEDTPGKATGDGFEDAFAGRRFTWHVVRSDGSTSSGASTSGSGGYGDYGG